jgi:uncharacterized secreted protein with C-terminal beta-propeller domain
MKIKNIFCILLIVIAMTVIAFACSGNAGGAPPEGDASETNNQTAGVDESDIVKVTACGYIFKAQSDGVTVTKTNNGAMQVMSKQAYQSFAPSEMFVTDNLVIVLGNKRVRVGNTLAFMTKAEVKIYCLARLKSGAAGAALRNSEFFGSFYTARLFDNQMYVTFRLSYTNFFADTGVNFFADSVEGVKSFETVDTIDVGTSLFKGYIIAKFDLSDVAEAQITAKFYAGERISDVYVSPFAIYIISGQLQEDFFRRGGGCTYLTLVPFSTFKTLITKLSLGDLSPVAETLFDGNILNRYSLYCNGLVLYVASTVGRQNAVFAFDRELELISTSAFFAPNESIFSARFYGELAYVVTFRTVDPLYKIDISDPTNIVVLGELKIDGYSTHLQVFGDEHLIGLGFETDLRGNPTGVKLVLFGVTNNDPVEITSVLFSDKFDLSQSEATSNPRAILSEPQNNIFAFPVTLRAENRLLYQGAAVYGIVNNKLTELAFLSNYNTGVISLTNELNITRIVRIGGFLYTISDGFITSHCLTDFSQIEFKDTRIEHHGKALDIRIPYASGNGTEDDPFIIKNGQQLLFFSEQVRGIENYCTGKFFALGSYIDIGGEELLPIGENGGRAFEGTFDGRGYIVVNFVIKCSGNAFQPHIGVFGRVRNATIKNLGVVGFDVIIKNTGYAAVGALVGSAYNSTIENCYVSNGLMWFENRQGGDVGGLAGYVSNTTVTNSFSAIEVFFDHLAQPTYTTAFPSSVGGLIGRLNSGAVANSYASGLVTLQMHCPNRENISYHVGGLVGLANGTITNSFATGNVFASAASGNLSAGGLVGNDSASVTNSYRYTGQMLTGNTNSLGSYVTMASLDDVLFYTYTLGWCDELWNFNNLDFYERKLPRLRGQVLGFTI